MIRKRIARKKKIDYHWLKNIIEVWEFDKARLNITP
jgi:hypothetical protein